MRFFAKIKEKLLEIRKIVVPLYRVQDRTPRPGPVPGKKTTVMKTRALTASEATARLFEIGFSKDSRNCIQDNDFTRPFGETNFTYANPRVNCFGPELIMWDMVGVRYSVEILEDYKGNSNVLLYRFNGHNGECIANYNKMKAAEKKDERGVSHSAFYAPDGKFYTFAERTPFLEFFPGEQYEYNGKPFVRK